MTTGSNAPAVKALVLSETSEAAAPSQIRAIYEEIRELCGVPMVALIFRHLAAHPGVLEEIWEAIGPSFRAGQIQETALQVARSTVPSGLLAPIEANARVVLGLIGEDLVKVRNTLEAYNRANPVNQLAMLSLIARLGNDTPAIARPVPRDWKPPKAIPGPLPQMISPDAMAPSVRLLINDFGFGDRSKLSPIVPSLFRHLAGWPSYLATIHVSLLPRFRDNSLANATNNIQQAMAREAASIGIYLPPLRRVAATPGIMGTISQFSSHIIPMMTVIGHAMLESLA
jgi:hypothetical protein